MLPEFDKNAGYIWAIVIIGFMTPLLLSVYVWLRAKAAKARLDRLEAQED